MTGQSEVIVLAVHADVEFVFLLELLHHVVEVLHSFVSGAHRRR